MESPNAVREGPSYAAHRKSHCHCIACGNANPASLRLYFDLRPDGSVAGTFKGSSLLQGYPGILHGGIISSLLDAAMTHCLFHHSIEAVTGELIVRFLHPVPCNAQLHIRARLIESRSILHRLESEVLHGNKKLAKATARFMERSNPY
ncbi:MAG: PaaI family thioesterase [Deltaproteobacteria bacterium]|nr:PaaI family thioesterase [Deltaproteobacteria bacterium]